MEELETGFDIGIGLLILVLTLSTAYLGYKTYLQLDLYHGLKDKATIKVAGGPVVSDNVPSLTLEDLAIIMTATSQNKDNVRQTSITVRSKTDFSDVEYKIECKLAGTYDENYTYLLEAIEEYCAIPSSYSDEARAGQYQTFVGANQSNIVCYILIEHD